MAQHTARIVRDDDVMRGELIVEGTARELSYGTESLSPFNRLSAGHSRIVPRTHLEVVSVECSFRL